MLGQQTCDIAVPDVPADRPLARSRSVVGDRVFEDSEVVVISVNEYFDGDLGDHVSKKSLHGQFIRDVLGGQSQAFFNLTYEALKGVAPQEADVARSSGRRDRYAIGTVARVDVNDRRYLLVALTRTDLSTLKASATVEDLWICLAGAWKGIRDYSNGQSVGIGCGSSSSTAPGASCERHGKSYLTCRRRGGEGGGGGLLTGRAIPSAYRWAWFRWYSRVVEVPLRFEVAAGFVAPGALEPPRLQPSWPPGGSRPAHG